MEKPKECAPGCVWMVRDGKRAEVRDGPSVALMQAHGWKIEQAVAESAPPKRPIITKQKQEG